jgi:type I site-specific restriction-modification system R (restriction) subunit
MSFSEDLVEQALLAILQRLGWRYDDPLSISPDSTNKQRTSNGEVVLVGLLTDAARRINPDIPEEALIAGIKQVHVSETPNIIEENRRIHRLEDKATVPIYYESRLARVELEQEKLPEIDAAVDALFDDETLSEQENRCASLVRCNMLVRP